MAPKGGNAKKESGRAKKAENEANKRAAAAEAKVRTIFRGSCPSSGLKSGHTHTPPRNGRKQTSGQMAQRPTKPRRRRKRSERRSLLAKRRTRDCSQKKRRRSPQRKPLQRQARRKPPMRSQSPRAPVPSPLWVRQQSIPPSLHKAPARMATSLRSRALLPRALTTHLI